MLGAIVGDIAGSRFERREHKSKDFELFARECSVTDDTVLTLAVGKSLMEWEKGRKETEDSMEIEWTEEDLGKLEELTVYYLKNIGRKYPYCGYGGRFIKWLFSDDSKPYFSFGNGAAMRVSSVAYLAKSVEEVRLLSKAVTGVTHNHKEGLKGAEAVAMAIFLARKGVQKTEIRSTIHNEYYPLDFTIDEIREEYGFDATCQNSVPQSIQCFLEGTSFEDAIRTAVSLGGDSDTIAAIAGSIAEAYYGVPESIRIRALEYLDRHQTEFYREWVTFLSSE